jgi:kumamolisin
VPDEERVNLLGSQPSPPPVGGTSKPASPTDRLVVSVYLRDPTATASADEPGEALTREAYATQHGASGRDIERLLAFARSHGLSVVSVDRPARRVQLAGGVPALEEAFGVQLLVSRGPAGVYRWHREPISLPASLAQAVTAVLGLDDLPAARPR